MNIRAVRATAASTSGWLKRWLLLLIGLILFGVGIAIMVRSRLGLGPWEVLHEGITHHTGLQIGTVSILVGIPVLLSWIPLRQRPGIGTVLNIFCIGLATNMTLLVLPPPAGLPLRLLWNIVGVILIGVGCGMYLSAHLGAGPRDGLMMGLHERSGVSVRLIRTLIEITVLLFGWLLGGTVGIGTILFALGIGPIVQPVLTFFGGLPKQQHPEDPVSQGNLAQDY